MKLTADTVMYDSEKQDFGKICGYLFSERGDVVSALKILMKKGQEKGFKGNLWRRYLAYYIADNENPFSLFYERNDGKSNALDFAAEKDFEMFYELFNLDLYTVFGEFAESIMKFDGGKFRGACDVLSGKFEKALQSAASPSEMMNSAKKFYAKYGAGDFAFFKAFKLTGSNIAPIANTSEITFDKLIGYELQKKELESNTEQFLKGRPANNVLLYGESGTGKSSSIKALLNKYYPSGLRMVEVSKNNFQGINSLSPILKTRGYKFIIYLDDLSFEEFETDYKYLKAVIDGSLEEKPSNVLIYASSNRRHLVREKISDNYEIDRSADIHRNETAEEKLSLSARFGLAIYYPSLAQSEFFNMAKILAADAGIFIDDETLIAEAKKWDMRGKGRSGRSASQFIKYLKYGNFV